MSTINRSIINDGLILYLDVANQKSYVSGSTTWTDISKNSNNGTLTNGPTYSATNNGNIQFDGVDDYVDIPNSNSLTLTGSFTVASWATRSSGSSGTLRLIANGADSDSLGQPGYFIGANNSTHIFSINPTGVRTTLTTPLLAFDVFNYIVGVFDTTGNMDLYINGILKVSTTSPIGSTTPVKPTYIGCRTVNDLNWVGNVATVQIFNRALSANEIQQNYQVLLPRFL